MLSSNRGDDIYRLGWRNLAASDSSPKVCRQSIPTTCAHSVLYSSSSTKGFFRIGYISKVVKHGHKKKKRKLRKEIFYIILKPLKTKQKESKFGLKTSFKKEKTKVLSTKVTECTCLRSPCSDKEAHFISFITQI